MFCADLFLFFYAVNLVYETDLSRHPDFYGTHLQAESPVTFIAVITDLPVQKNNSVKCELKLLEISRKEHFEKNTGTILVYFKGSVAKQLAAGQTLLIKSSLTEVPSPKNPFEFDYRNYLFNKQIYHTAFIDSSAFIILKSEEQLHPVWMLGLHCKNYVLAQLRNSELSQNAYAICSALITGYDDEIDKQVMESFSHSGTLHVLSVSGLHTGLIYMVLNFLFSLFDRKNKYKIIRFILVTILLWLFALITGFSAPVLRAVIMFNLFGIGHIWFRAQHRHQLNILLVSAFILLSYNPFYILDVGFLLSYFALFGLIWFQPKFSKFWQPSNRFLNYIWQSITASTAATISTLPLTLFFFKQFPLWFLVCNIVVVPATFILLMLAVCIVLKMNFVGVIINYFVSGLLWFINLFNTRNSGFIDNIHFTFMDALLLSLLIILFSAAIYYRSYKQLMTGLIVVVCWQCYSLVISYKIKTSCLFTVYCIKHQSALSLKNKTNVLLSIPGSTSIIDSAHFASLREASTSIIDSAHFASLRETPTPTLTSTLTSTSIINSAHFASLRETSTPTPTSIIDSAHFASLRETPTSTSIIDSAHLASLRETSTSIIDSAHFASLRETSTSTSTLTSNYHVNPHLVSFNYPDIHNKQFNFFRYSKGAILILQYPNSMPDVDYNQITILVITNNVRLQENELQKFTNLQTIVLDNSNNKFTAQHTEKLSCKFGICFYSVPESGAFLLELG